MRETKCFRCSTACARQTKPPVQRRDRIYLARLLVDVAHRMAAADRAGLRKLVGDGVFRALLQHHVDDLRDHVARALDDRRRRRRGYRAPRGSARRCCRARDIVLVVQRRIGDHHAADRHRLQPRHRRQRAGAADLDVDRASASSAPARPGTCGPSPSAAMRERKPRRSCRSSWSTL